MKTEDYFERGREKIQSFPLFDERYTVREGICEVMRGDERKNERML